MTPLLSSPIHMDCCATRALPTLRGVQEAHYVNLSRSMRFFRMSRPAYIAGQFFWVCSPGSGGVPAPAGTCSSQGHQPH